MQSNADRVIGTDMLFDTIQASRNLDNSSEKKMFTLSLDITVGIEAAKLSPIENVIEKLRKWERKERHTHRQRKKYIY